MPRQSFFLFLLFFFSFFFLFFFFFFFRLRLSALRVAAPLDPLAFQRQRRGQQRRRRRRQRQRQRRRCSCRRGRGARRALRREAKSGGELRSRALLPAAPEALRALQAACRLEPDPANRDAEARAAAARALPLVAARVAARFSVFSSIFFFFFFFILLLSPRFHRGPPRRLRGLLHGQEGRRRELGAGSRVEGRDGAAAAAGRGRRRARGGGEGARAARRQGSRPPGLGEVRQAPRGGQGQPAVSAAQGRRRVFAGRGAAGGGGESRGRGTLFLRRRALQPLRTAAETTATAAKGEGRGLRHLHTAIMLTTTTTATTTTEEATTRPWRWPPPCCASLPTRGGRGGARGLRGRARRAARPRRRPGPLLRRYLCFLRPLPVPSSSSASAAVVRALVAAWATAVASGGEEASRLTTPFLKAADALLSGVGEEEAAARRRGRGSDSGGAERLLCAAADPSVSRLALRSPRRCSTSPWRPAGVVAIRPGSARPRRCCATWPGVDGRRKERGEGSGNGDGEEEEAESRPVVGLRTTAARALRAAASLTGHSYPTVRRAAADNFSLRLLMGIPVVDGEERGGKERENERARAAVWRESGSSSGGGGGGGTGGGEKGEEQEEVETLARRPDAAAASDLLSETAWDAATPSARAARARLFELLGLPAPGGDAAAGAEEAAAGARRGGARQKMGGGGEECLSGDWDEHSSSSGYRSLIDAVSRGGAD